MAVGSIGRKLNSLQARSILVSKSQKAPVLDDINLMFQYYYSILYYIFVFKVIVMILVTEESTPSADYFDGISIDHCFFF